VDAIAGELSALLAHPCYDAAAVNERVLEPASADSLAEQLADVFERCLA
jgi:hypothetical protein